ncbi:hypothetical protein [uncultured Parasphingorhabdus sp.]|jgi:hypothetical protein|uniref:hypothetical protein n=1 Tax=uncultured Parasphingorhabdus sp. TaxID=2709694 RepID=UPI002AA8BD23|nr:hypothetical protein [uncultured Parasphingorhabdus sp.]
MYALYRGGGPERCVAGIVIAMVLLDPAVHIVTPLEYSALDPGHLVIDLAGWLALVAVALRANRFWPLCVASLQTIALVAHVTRMLDVTIHPKAYMIMQIASSYPLLVLLMVGTICHQKRLKAIGIDRSWRT